MQKGLEKKYPKLKARFPEEFIYLFDSTGNLNSQGKMAQQILELESENAALKKQLAKSRQA
jgi:hypothetical protein